jgi:hypothetical protein
MTHRPLSISTQSSVGEKWWVGLAYNISNRTGSKQQMVAFKITALYKRLQNLLHMLIKVAAAIVT